MVTDFIMLILAVLSVLAYGCILAVVIVFAKKRLDKLLGRIVIHRTEEEFKICISGMSEKNLVSLYNELALLCVKYTDQLKVTVDKVVAEKIRDTQAAEKAHDIQAAEKAHDIQAAEKAHDIQAAEKA